MRKYFHFLNFTQLKWWKQCWCGCLPLACVKNFPISAGVQYFNNQINKLDYYERPSNHILIWFIFSHVFNKLAQTSQNIMKLYCWLNAKSHKKWRTLSIILSGRSQTLIWRPGNKLWWLQALKVKWFWTAWIKATNCWIERFKSIIQW